MAPFDQWSIDAKSAVTLENCALVEEVTLHFQLCHQRSLLKCHCTFYIYGQWGKKVCTRLLKKVY